MKKGLFALVILVSTQISAHIAPLEDFKAKPILADLADLKALNIPILAKDPVSGVGYAVVTPEMQQKIQTRAHQVGKCGGFESLASEVEVNSVPYFQALSDLSAKVIREKSYERAPFQALALEKKMNIQAALDEAKEENLRDYVTWLSSFPSRYNRASEPNTHVVQLKEKLEGMLKDSKWPYEVTLISHQQTPQKSLRVRLVGSTKPQEIVVLGAHLDSINQSWGGGDRAPGADDNASGSSNLIEALRVLSAQPQSPRSVEFFWYAGEESGLLGSAEIAKDYKNQKKDVVAALQLDMTLFPGSGQLVLASMTDFTSAWLRDYLKAMNETYLNVQIVEDRCGYGCSDHASWYRQGYPTLMPFEAQFSRMNHNIHTSRDVITPEMSFRHSLVFTRIALVLAMDLANSDARQPY